MPDAQSPLSAWASETPRARYLSRVPASLDELTGPAYGTVQLPLHIAWSGLTAFDVGSPKPRMTLYRTVLAEGQRGDLARYLNRDLLISQWPVPGACNRGSAATRPRINHQDQTGGHTGHSTLPSHSHQPGCTGIPVGVTPTGIRSGECGTNRNTSPAAGRARRSIAYLLSPSMA
jgi:hypothetical protein